MKLWQFSACLLAALFSNTVAAADAAQGETKHDWGQHDKGQLSEGDITIEAADGTRKVAKVLGGPLGKETVDGIEVGLFVLQASNPERLKPGAKGPTHIFNVTFMEEGGSQLITDALGAVIIEREGLEPQRVQFKRSGSHHEAYTRLDQMGAYQISVEFVSGSHKGHTQTMLFDYTGKFMFPGHAHHNH